MAAKTSDRVDQQWRTLEILLEWVSRYDMKSSVLLGLNTAMLGVLAGFSPRTWAWTLAPLLWLAASGLVSASALTSIIGNFPRTRTPNHSLVFFGSIATHTLASYRDAVGKRTDAYLLEDLSAQCHRNAEILAFKFKCLRFGYWATMLGLLPWALAVMLYAKGSA